VYVVVGNGDEPVIARVADAAGVRDLPYAPDGVQLTLRDALATLAARGDVGDGGLVELDTDGRPASR